MTASNMCLGSEKMNHRRYLTGILAAGGKCVLPSPCECGQHLYGMHNALVSPGSLRHEGGQHIIFFSFSFLISTFHMRFSPFAFYRVICFGIPSPSSSVESKFVYT